MSDGEESEDDGGESDGEGGESVAKILTAKGKSMTSERWTWGQDLGCLDFDSLAKAKTIDEGCQQ